MDSNFVENFKHAYEGLYELHPLEPENPKLQYVNKTWFFKNHLDIVLRNIKKFHKQYFSNSNLQVALFGGLFHDAGLVYNRETESPAGHESRSEEYAEMVLTKMEYEKDFVELVKQCIRATEADAEATQDEAKLVRTADAYSHMTSIHFFAKSNFAPNIENFIDWFSKKLEGTYHKIEIEELKKEVTPLYEKYSQMIGTYRKNQTINLLEDIFDL